MTWDRESLPVPCPHCARGQLTVSVDGVSLDGRAVQITVACSNCDYEKIKQLNTGLEADAPGVW